MPLPPALAAKLAKRGILKDASVEGYDPVQGRAVELLPEDRYKGRKKWTNPPGQNKEPEEEVFAESYDDNDDDLVPVHAPGGPSVSSLAFRNSAHLPGPTVELDKTKYLGHSGCPNKWNVWHECVLFCRTFWDAGLQEPVNQDYIRVHGNMMQKYFPLPDGWREMYDPGVGRHYYWCTKTDKVSWLPPGHPRARITEAASQVREMLASKVSVMDDEEDNMDLDSDMEGSGSDGEDRRIEEQRRKEKERRRDEERSIKNHRKDSDHKKGRRKGDEDALDPMDPSAYCPDVPRGSWSTGLPDQGSAKTGVDSTASGPLFQQRPYPSPGAILRANAAKEK